MKHKKVPMVENLELDDLDRRMLNQLMRDASVPFSDIARELDVSPGTVHIRMKKLQDAGVVRSTHIEVDYSKIGFDISAFLGVHLVKGSEYEVVIEALRKIPEVTEAYFTTGPYSIFLRIVCRNTKHLYDLLNHKIQRIPGVERTETLICLEESIRRQVSLED
jgi:Lrp/AsnC family transcriptional regulator for asnA, asnC and gidA